VVGPSFGRRFYCYSIPPYSVQGLPGNEVLGEQSSGVGLSITDLVAAGTSLSNVRQDNSDDDYD
jgi:hypothetical protein